MIFDIDIYITGKSIAYKKKVKTIPFEMCGALFFFFAKSCGLVQVKILLSAAEWTSTALLHVSALPNMPKLKPVVYLFIYLFIINGTKIGQFIRQATARPPNFWVYQPPYIYSIREQRKEVSRSGPLWLAGARSMLRSCGKASLPVPKSQRCSADRSPLLVMTESFDPATSLLLEGKAKPSLRAISSPRTLVLPRLS